MIIKRRVWSYRLPGQTYAQVISFERPVTAAKVRETLRRSVGLPLDLWGRSGTEPVPQR